mmetsp:Transcript_170682/g.547495  ORF Transcript_170682/g.547495 Transcript_170682/m.547495 type:complete len:237 (-) Transcript_170682:493-1203(-)
MLLLQLEVRVGLPELCADDGHGQRDEHDARDHGHATDDAAEERPRHLIAVADGRHRHQRPPPSRGDRLEVVGRVPAVAAQAAVLGPAGPQLVALGPIARELYVRHLLCARAGQALQVVHQGAEEHHGYAQQQVQNAEGLGGAHDGLRHHGHAGRVLAELEHPEDPHEPHRPEDLEGPDGLDVFKQEDGDNRHEVDDVAWSLHKLLPRHVTEGAAGSEPQGVLPREDHEAADIQNEP